jgi:hypothetical protein
MLRIGFNVFAAFDIGELSPKLPANLSRQIFDRSESIFAIDARLFYQTAAPRFSLPR